MKIIDTHFHLDLHENDSSVADEIEKNGIYTIAVTNAPSVFFHTLGICKSHKFVRAALGYHPEIVSRRPNEFEIFNKEIKKTKYIGEIGLDNSPRNSKSFAIQKKIFIQIIELCNLEGGKILTIHSRKAEKDVIDIIGRSFNGKVILHYYTGSLSNLKKAIEYGFYFSVNLNMTATKSGIQIISEIPINRILTESDYPFTYKGIDHNSVLLQTIQNIASIKACNQLDVSNKIFKNLKKVLI